MRLHPTSIKAAGFVSKRVLDFFGLELEDLVKTRHLTGVAVDGDDLLLDPAQLLPPPQIRGRLTRAWVENGLVMQQFGGTIPRAAIAPAGRHTNYMYYRRGTLRFGKLTMRDADLLLVDSDPKDPFDFSPKDYNDQLIAGYSKNTPARGLIVYMPDLGDLPARRATPVTIPLTAMTSPTRRSTSTRRTTLPSTPRTPARSERSGCIVSFPTRPRRPGAWIPASRGTSCPSRGASTSTGPSCSVSCARMVTAHRCRPRRAS